MDREVRKLHHNKQDVAVIKVGVPSNDELVEGVTQLRYVSGSGLFWYLKYNNTVYRQQFAGPNQQQVITTSIDSDGTPSGQDHGDLDGLTDDDHTQYLLIDGTRAMTGDLNLDGGEGALSFTADDSSIQLLDNQSASLVIQESSNAYLTFVTTNSGEKIVSAKPIEGTTFDATTDFTVGSTVITDDSIVMTPSANDTITISGATNGVLNIQTVDNAAAAANISIVADGMVEVRGHDLVKIGGTSAKYLSFTNSSGSWTLSNDSNNGDFHITTKDGSNVRASISIDASENSKTTLYGALNVGGGGTAGLPALALVRDFFALGIGLTDSTTSGTGQILRATVGDMDVNFAILANATRTNTNVSPLIDHLMSD